MVVVAAAVVVVVVRLMIDDDNDADDNRCLLRIVCRVHNDILSFYFRQSKTCNLLATTLSTL